MGKENANIEYSLSIKEAFPFHYNEFNQDSIFKNKNIRYKVIKEKKKTIDFDTKTNKQTNKKN